MGCSDKVSESSFYVSPEELNVDSISDIKTFKPLHQLSFDRGVEFGRCVYWRDMFNFQMLVPSDGDL